MKRHQRDLELISDLNLTNMLDTAFVLLVVFIMVAPMVKQGINLELPQVTSGPMQADQKTFTIQIGKVAGTDIDRIYVDEQAITIEDLSLRLELERTSTAKFDVVLEADAAARYETFAQVLGLLKQMGIENVGIATDPVQATTEKKPTAKKPTDPKSRP